MAIPLLAAAVPYVAAAVGTGANMYAQGKMNSKTRAWAEDQTRQQQEFQVGQWWEQNKYNESMWEKQKGYNQSVWEQQNAYDSPAAQMQRFRDAGLNPNLIYGQMNGGQSMDVAPANMPAPTSQPSRTGWDPKALPRVDPLGAMMQINGMKQMELQNNNLEADYRLKEKEAAIKDMQTVGLGIGNMAALRDYDFTNQMNPVSLDYKKKQIENYESQVNRRVAQTQIDFSRLGLEKTRVGQFVAQSQQAISESIARTGSINAGIPLIQQKVQSEIANRGLTLDRQITEEGKPALQFLQKYMAGEKLTKEQSDLGMKAVQMLLNLLKR